MLLSIEVEREDDGRWFGTVDELPGVMAYGTTRDEAATATQALALRVLAERDEHGSVLHEPRSIFRARIEELKLLRNGWLDGRGLAPPLASLDWITNTFEERYPDDLRLPYLFPTAEGRVLAEWSLTPWSLSLEIDPIAKRGFWHALNLDSDDQTEKELDLSSDDEWTWLAEQVRSRGGVAE